MRRFALVAVWLVACGEPEINGQHVRPGAFGKADGFCEKGQLPAAWNSGVDCATEPELQVHEYNEDTFILRQSICTNFEAPFIYLLFGKNSALLLDTGTGNIDLRSKVDELIDEWQNENGSGNLSLTVLNSHNHGDHTAGNSQFVDRPNTTVVGAKESKVKEFFGFTAWPDGVAKLELGERALSVLPIPGHQGSDIAVYDPSTGIFLTGDTVLPGRLFIRENATYKASIRRLLDFVSKDDKSVCQVLGAHIEMKKDTPGEAFDFGTSSHPNEHHLELSFSHLIELDNALEKMGTDIVQEAHDDFIIFPL